VPTEDTLVELFAVLAAIVVMGGIIVAANLADRDHNTRLRRAVKWSLIAINSLIILLYGVMQLAQGYWPADNATDLPSKTEAWAALVGSLIVGGLAIVLTSSIARARIAVLFPRSRPVDAVPGSPQDRAVPSTVAQQAVLTPQEGKPLFPQILNYYTDTAQSMPQSFQPSVQRSHTNRAPKAIGAWITRGFDPHSSVHLVALVFVIDMLGVQFIDFILAGGLSGVAQSLEGSINGWSLAINMLPLVVLPLLGVGFATRRDARATLDRLGVGIPSPQGLVAAAGMTILLFAFVAIVSAIWMGAVSEETFKEQTEASDALASGVTTLGLAFLLAFVAAVGEEIAFRGALQPVLGFWPTAGVFALTHAQYTLTPAWLIIFGVALGIGWIRYRYNTTVAMITHFAYNFIPLALALYAPEQAIALFMK